MPETDHGNEDERRPPFCPNIDEVLDAIRQTNPGDAGTERFIARLGEKIRIRNAGFPAHLAVTNGHGANSAPPIAFLVIGEPRAEFERLFLALGNSFIGKPAQGRPSITRIDCPNFADQGLSGRAWLVGSMNPEETGGFIPFLWPVQLRGPDVFSHAGTELLPLERVGKELNYAAGNELYARHKGEELKDLTTRLQDAVGEIIEKYTPYRSVVVLTSIEFAPPWLIGLALSAIRDGLVDTTSGPSYFENAIVLLTMRDPDCALRDNETPTERFRRIREKIWSDPRYQNLLEVLRDDRVIVIDPPTRNAQAKRRDLTLGEIIKTFAEDFAVELSFTQGFTEFLLDEVENPTNPALYPDGRLEEMCMRYVIEPIAEKLSDGELRRNGMIRLMITPNGQNGRRVVPKVAPPDPENPGSKITPEEVAKSFGPDPELLKPPMTEQAQEFHDELHEIMRDAEAEEQKNVHGQYV